MILHYFRKKENKEKKIAENIYKNILYKSNYLINEYNLFKNKNYNSSFEVVSIFLIIYIKNSIYKNNNKYSLINDNLISIFISDLDESLRVKGISDISIGKYVKSYVKKFYFRLSKFPDFKENKDQYFLAEYLKLFDFIEGDKFNEASNKILKLYQDIDNLRL